MIDKVCIALQNMTLVCLSFLIISGVPSEYYAGLIVLILLDGILAFLINSKVKPKTLVKTFLKMIHTIFFLVVVAISFNVVVLIKTEIMTYNIVLVRFILGTYLMYLLKTALIYFQTTDVAEGLIQIVFFMKKVLGAVSKTEDFRKFEGSKIRVEPMFQDPDTQEKNKKEAK